MAEELCHLCKKSKKPIYINEQQKFECIDCYSLRKRSWHSLAAKQEIQDIRHSKKKRCASCNGTGYV